MIAEKTQPSEHLFARDMESAKRFDYKIDRESLLLDIKALLREYYAATFTAEADALKLQFTNGQSFILSAKEVL